MHSENKVSSCADESESNLVERFFYSDCDPEQAIDRTTRVEKVASLLNANTAFGSLRNQDEIRDSFQAEVEVSRNPAEALSRIVKFLSLINLKLNNGMRLGPGTMAVSDRIYLNSSDAPTQSLDLNLRMTAYGKKASQSGSFISIAS